VIDATELQGTQVSTATPTNGQVLQAVNGVWQPATIIAVGPQSGLQSLLPLGLGEIYVASDTGNLFIGTPGVGVGYIEVANTNGVNDLLTQILQEMRALKLAIISLDSTLLPGDYIPQDDSTVQGIGEQ
jgi:hypothetical protein